MPIYEFECPDCDIFFEEQLSLAQLDEVVVKCPSAIRLVSKRSLVPPPFSSGEGAPILPALK